MEITSNTGTSATGVFDFAAIGLSGLFSWDSASNYTGGTPTSSSTFDALTLTAVPEPPSLLLAAVGLAVLIAGGVLRRSRLIPLSSLTHRADV